MIHHGQRMKQKNSSNGMLTAFVLFLALSTWSCQAFSPSTSKSRALFSPFIASEKRRNLPLAYCAGDIDSLTVNKKSPSLKRCWGTRWNAARKPTSTTRLYAGKSNVPPLIRGGGSEDGSDKSRPLETALHSTATSTQSTSQTTSTSQPTSTASSTKVTTNPDQFLKPQPDTRTYRSILLPNNLHVLLISDPKTDTEAASVHLQTGHFQDLPHRKGLAHFHEHMLFLGTEKYPQEDEFEDYLVQHGGYSNAYTDMEDTNYYLCVAPLNHEDTENDKQDIPQDKQDSSTASSSSTVSTALQGALDRFAQFFIAPSFRSDAVERELRAIDSEYANAISSDAWRSYQLLKSESNANHPFHKFGCGNYNTLTNGGILHENNNNNDDGNDENDAVPDVPFRGGTSPRDDLIGFWKDHYHASNMKLAVLSRGNLDDLQAVVEETFGKVREIDSTSDEKEKVNGGGAIESEEDASTTNMVFPAEHAKYHTAAFQPQHQLNLVREVIPVRQSRKVKLQFAVPPTDDPLLLKTMPQRLISHLLGHESPGSLHAVLNDMGYVTGLSSGTAIDASDFALFGLSIGLTPQGLEHVDEVLDLCFQWLALIRTLLPSEGEDEPNGKGSEQPSMSRLEEYHEELRQLNRIGFTFRENGDPISFCSSASELMFRHDDGPELILAGHAMFANYSAPVTRAFMDRFTPENCLITVEDSDLKHGDESRSPGLRRVLGEEGQSDWKKEEWYMAEYRQTRIPKEMAEKWKNPPQVDGRLKLPPLNQFVATDFSLRCDDDKEDKGIVVEDIAMNGKVTDQATVTTTSSSVNGVANGEAKVTPTPPEPLSNTREGLRLWHKTDETYRVPKTSFRIHLTSPKVYASPKSMTYCRLFQRVLDDDLNSYVYDARVAGCSYKFTVLPSGFSLVVSGYSEKLPVLLRVLAERIHTLLQDMENKDNENSALRRQYAKAKVNLRRETQNHKLDGPLETANYNSRMLMEETVWHLDDYLDVMSDGTAQNEDDDGLVDEGGDTDVLPMEECARVMEECLASEVKMEALSMGNINENGARELLAIVEDKLLKAPGKLTNVELPRYKSLQLPTKREAAQLLKTPSLKDQSIPLVIQDVAASDSEENHAVEITMQVGNGATLGYKQMAYLQLIAHMSYNSAYNVLRTQEQLGYLVSSNVRKTAGHAFGLTVEVQSNTALPELLEERCEAWLVTFRKELEDMSEERLAKEAAAVVAQLLERDVTLSEETTRMWEAIGGTALLAQEVQPVFDRMERLASFLSFSGDKAGDSSPNKNDRSGDGPANVEDLKRELLLFFDRHFAAASEERRVISSRVYGRSAKDKFLQTKGKPGVLSSHEDVKTLKQFLYALPTMPYWI